MKKSLPNLNKKGFTLVELMVAITIIAILSIIGVTIFTGVQKNARDAQRRGDIDATAKALETNKTTNSTTYNSLTPQMFTAGRIPTDPRDNINACGSQNNKLCVYCLLGASGECPANPVRVDGTNPTSTATSWTVCANLEGGSGTNTYYCKSSAQ